MNERQLTRKILAELGARANVKYGDASFDAVLELVEEYAEGWQASWERQAASYQRYIDALEDKLAKRSEVHS